MAKTCEGCKFVRVMPFGDTTATFCTRNPPQVQFVQSGDKITLNSFYPPIGPYRCGQFKRRWFWWLRR